MARPLALAVILLLTYWSSARAQESSIDVRAALTNHARYAEDGGTQAELPADHADFAALHDYVRELAAKNSSPGEPNQIKFAEADSLIDALHDFLKRQNGAAPAPSPAAPAPTPQAPLVQASYVGSKVCLGCHSEQAHLFSHTLMGRLQTQGKMQCETCHGPGSEHVRLGGGRGVGGIISFRSDDTSHSAADNNRICLGCHERGDRTNWHGSVHEVRGLMCTSCHTVMKDVSRKNNLKTAWEPDTCFQCHKDRRAQMFRSAHMPMREGKIVCSDCHNPHGSFTEALLKKDSINDVCYTCHAEKRGPFLFEHAPVRENCDNCHDPHGSVNEASLKLSRPRLCFECHGFGHGQTTGLNSAFTMGRACLNCHTAIHGSNSPAGFFLQR
jgi:DmsE family decaheme c-type cytochrome